MSRKQTSLFGRKLNRRQFLTGSAVLGAAALAGPTFITACSGGAGGGAKQLDKVTFVSPRGTLEVMDDWNLWVPIEMGYFKDLGIEVDMQPGPNDALASAKLVGERQADVGYPSPGVLLAAIDAGVPVVLGWEMMMGQVFDYVTCKGSGINSIQDLKGKKIAIGMEGWSVISDPILVEAGIDPSEVTYVAAGSQVGQMVALCEVDAGLTWRGLVAQWRAQGLEFDLLRGTDFSNQPSNGYCIHKDDLTDDKRKDIITRFMKGNAMGFEFGRYNPQAAAQIVYKRFSSLQEQMTPQLAFDSWAELAEGYFQSCREGHPYGYASPEGWQNYIDTVYNLGQIKTDYKAEDVITNYFVDAAADFDAAKAKKDAEAYKLDPEFQSLTLNYQLC